MKSDLTDITLVVDRSGSMEQVREDAEGGVNSFIEQQVKEPGEALLTLVQFDTEYEFVHKGVPITEVPRYQLVPRGMTALLDAVGRAINETGERLAKMDDRDRPGLVVFVVMTDGLENSSKEFSKSDVKAMIERQQDKYNWHFTFLGANQDICRSWKHGHPCRRSGQLLHEQGERCIDGDRSQGRAMRKQRSTGETVKNEFTDKEREDMA